MKNLVIITSYLETKFDFKLHIPENAFIMCLDEGYNIAVNNGLYPDMVIGDLDSLKGSISSDINVLQYPPEKDYTDLELGLMKTKELGASNVKIIGGIGGRLDHTIANIQLLSQYTNHFDNLVLMDGRNKCFVLNEIQKTGVNISPENDSYLSLFSLSEQCTGLNIENVKYPLTNYTLPRTGSLCVSNEFNKKDAIISIDDGTLLVVISRK